MESLEEEVETEKLDSTHVGAVLTQITPKSLMAMQMAAETLSKLNQEAIVPQLTIMFGDNITFSCKDLDSKLAGYFAQKLREIEMFIKLKETHCIGTLKLKQPITLDSQKITAFTPISAKAIFKLRVTKK